MQSAAHAIENLPNEQAALAKMKELLLGQTLNYIEQGGVLQVMKDKGWHAGASTFKELCEHKIGLGLRRAQYFMSIYNFVLDAELTWEAVQEIGWTSLRELCGKVEPEALPGWLDDAKTMTVLELREALKADQDSDAPGTTVAKLSTMTFKLHEDQRAALDEALEKARTEVDTSYDAVAIEHVCLNFLSGPKAKKGRVKAVSFDQIFVEQFRKLGITAALDLIPDTDFDPAEMVVEFLEETGEEEAQRLFNLAFPEDPDPASLVKAG